MKRKMLKLTLSFILGIASETTLVAKIDWNIKTGFSAQEAKEVQKLDLTKQAELLVGKLKSGLNLDISTIAQEFSQIENSIKILIGDVDQVSNLLVTELLKNERKIATDLEQFKEKAKKILDSGKITLNDMVSAITDPVKLVQIIKNLNPQDITQLNSLDKTFKEFINDLNELSVKSTLDSATNITKKIALFFESLLIIEKKGGLLSSFIISRDLQKILKNLSTQTNKLASNIALIYDPINILEKNIKTKLAFGLISNLSKIENLKNEIDKNIALTETSIKSLKSKIKRLSNPLANLSNSVSKINEEILNKLINIFKQNPTLILTQGVPELKTITINILKKLSHNISLPLLLIHDFFVDFITILQSDIDLVENFDTLLGKDKIIPKKSINALKATETDIKSILMDLAALVGSIK